jgi:hypothetical protein
VNPDHLFVGTNSDNLLDASRKGRLPCVPNAGRFSGTYNPARRGAPIDHAELRAVLRDLRNRGHSFKFIADKLGVSQRTVRRVYWEMTSGGRT